MIIKSVHLCIQDYHGRLVTVPEKFTELMSLVRDQKLYLEAMSILPLGSQEREVMWKALQVVHGSGHLVFPTPNKYSMY